MNRRFPATDVGPADLARLLQVFSEKYRSHIGLLLGYVYDESCNSKSSQVPQSPRKESDSAAEDQANTKRDGDNVKQAQCTLWCVRYKAVLDAPDPSQSALSERSTTTLTDFPALELGKPPAYQHLVPWARLWPVLKDILSRHLLSRLPDERIIQQRLNRGEFLQDVPRKKRCLWASGVVLALDDDLRHFPLFGEYAQIRHGLSTELGRHALHVCQVASGPKYGLLASGKQVVRPLLEIARDRQVLILSDLGHYDSHRLQRDWLEFGRDMQQRGVRPVVISPVPRPNWNDAWEELFGMLSWEDLAQEFTVQDDVEKLLALVSPAVRVEPRLLRALRRLLPRAGVETELRAWNHKDVCATYLAFEFVPEKQISWRTAFEQLAPDLQDKAMEILADFHAFLPAEVQFEERLSCAMLLPRKRWPEDEDLTRFLAWLEHALTSANDAASKEAVRSWMQRVATRLDDRVRKVPGAHHISTSLAKSFIATEGDTSSRTLPAWIKDDEWEQAIGKKTDLQNWELRQIGQLLRVCRSGEDTRGCLLAHLAAKQLLEICQDGRSLGKESIETGRFVPLKALRQVNISSDWMGINLAAMLKPQWADAIIQRADGLFCTWNGLEVPWVLREQQGRYEVRPYNSGDAKKVKGTVEYGMWQFPDRSELSWASRIGEDQYGLYAEFDFQGVTQRMRWIMPGTFLMGSPEDEPARDGDETQHEVTLTHGFWLAETACTQELWQSVMGEKPSDFKGPEDLPVENVSWDMCQEFCTRINKAVPGLSLRLPTEAQWEYACRAGTTTPFSFGENITTDQVNFDGNYPYNDGPKGEYRERTVPVCDLPCNQWGLFQMHGNVREWCADWFGDYPERPVTDPVGPESGESRVLRGGSWDDYGRFVRSAFRSDNLPVGRYNFIGFRFSRGHQG